MQDQPTGKLCECGCGQPTAIAKTTNRTRGHTKGQPLRFLHGHELRRDPVERFWEKVDKRGPDDCWEWTGCRNRGYGNFGRSGSSSARAHRVSYEMAHGPIPDGLNVCHTCDNPPCCNPAHLFLGTQTDNMRDAAGKGRIVIRRRTKLTEAQVREIRHLAATGESDCAIGRQFGVASGTIRHIRIRRTWGHVQ